MQAGWGGQILDQESLYDLLFDPTEHANLVDDPAHKVIAQDMRDRLRRRMVATNDPLLNGPVKAPRERSPMIQTAYPPRSRQSSWVLHDLSRRSAHATSKY